MEYVKELNWFGNDRVILKLVDVGDIVYEERLSICRTEFTVSVIMGG